MRKAYEKEYQNLLAYQEKIKSLYTPAEIETAKNRYCSYCYLRKDGNNCKRSLLPLLLESSNIMCPYFQKRSDEDVIKNEQERSRA
jgi:hypothetical protein